MSTDSIPPVTPAPVQIEFSNEEYPYPGLNPQPQSREYPMIPCSWRKDYATQRSDNSNS